MNGTRLSLPRARIANLVITELHDELLIYDLKKDRAYCLNPAAKAVWSECDGKTDADVIAGRVSANLDIPFDTDAVWYALAQLHQKELLQEPLTLPLAARTLTRRAFLKKTALAGAIAVPTILALRAPVAAQAGTCVPNDGNCVASAQCCSQCCTATGGGANTCKPGSGNCLP